jgi:preprotein translocase subunit SecG
VALLIVVASAALAVVAMLLLRRRAPEGGAFSDSDRASGVFGLLGAGFAIFLGFVIFVAFDDYDRAKQASSDEAEATLQQFENAHLFAPAEGHVLEGQLICYARAVIERGWPGMEANRQSPIVDLWSLRLERTSEAIPIAGAKANAAYQSWLTQTEERSKARNTRLREAQHPLPPLLWVLIVIAALCVIGFVLFYADPAEAVRAQALIAGSVTAVVVAGILLVVFLNSPYGSGSGTIKPSAMGHSLALMQAQYRGTVPCTPDGAPTRV